jgi:hypothetical protein
MFLVFWKKMLCGLRVLCGDNFLSSDGIENFIIFRTMKNKPKENSFFPDTPFIVCKRRKNQPQISPLICEKRCPRNKNCQEYFDYLQPAMFERYEKREAKEKSILNRIPDRKDPREGQP